MLIYLPIIVNNKYCSIPFTINKNTTTKTIIINFYNKEYKYTKVTLINSFNVFNMIDIVFPLKLNIVQDFVYDENLMIFNILSDHKYNDFIFSLNKNLNECYNLSYINLINIKKYYKHIYTDFNNFSKLNNIKYSNIECFLKFFFKKITYIYNIVLLSYYFNDLKIELTKKQKQILNKFNQKEYKFYGIKYKFIEHNNNLNLIKNKVKIKTNNFYFFKKNLNMNIIKIINITNDSIVYKKNEHSNSIITDIDKINNYIFLYNPECYEYFNRINILRGFLKNLNYCNYLDIILLYYNKDYVDIYNYLVNSNLKDNILIIRKLNLTFTSIEKEYSNILSNYIITTPTVSFQLFIKWVKKKSYDENILLKLLDNTLYPYNYNTKNINTHFLKILYYSFKFINNIYINELDNKIFKLLTNKNKYIYLNVIKFYNYYNNNLFNQFKTEFKFSNDINNIMFYIKLLNNNFIFTNKEKKNRYLEIFVENYKLKQVFVYLNWNNINQKYDYLCYVFKSTLFSNYKHKYIFDIHSKIIKIIANPLYLFSFLKNKNDFIKWSVTIKDNIQVLYYNKIKFYPDDYINIGKLIYFLYKTKLQNIDNNDYKKLLQFCIQNKKLIIYNNKLNINRNMLDCTIHFDLLYKNMVNMDKKFSIVEYDQTVSDYKYFKYKYKYNNIKNMLVFNNIE